MVAYVGEFHTFRRKKPWTWISQRKEEIYKEKEEDDDDDDKRGKAFNYMLNFHEYLSLFEGKTLVIVILLPYL